MCSQTISFILFLSGTLSASPEEVLSASTLPSTVDLGTFFSGNTDLVRREFAFRNDTESALTFARVATDCHCITAELDEALVAPGKSMKLSVTLDPRYLSFGRFEHMAFLITNDPVPKQFVINFSGELQDRATQLYASPLNVFVIASKSGQKSVNFLQLRRAGDKPIGELSVSTSASWLHAKLKPYSDPNTQDIRTRLAVFFEVPPNTHGDLVEHVVVHGASPEDQLTVPVFIKYHPEPPTTQRFFMLEALRDTVRIPLNPTYVKALFAITSHTFESDSLTLESLDMPTAGERSLSAIVSVKDDHRDKIATGVLRCIMDGGPDSFEIVFVHAP